MTLDCYVVCSSAGKSLQDAVEQLHKASLYDVRIGDNRTRTVFLFLLTPRNLFEVEGFLTVVVLRAMSLFACAQMKSMKNDFDEMIGEAEAKLKSLALAVNQV